MNPRTLLGSSAAVLLAGCASAPPAVVPAPLEPPAGEALAATVAAHGVQIYACRAEPGAAPAWAFVAPEAELFDASGRSAGTHGAGPFWRAADGSRITGSVKARAEAPRAGAIAWLLLATRSDGKPGAFERVTSVQRVNTTGGVAPVTPCTTATLGRVERVAYSADYRLFTRR